MPSFIKHLSAVLSSYIQTNRHFEATGDFLKLFVENVLKIKM
jgi:hypothetical protein